MFGHLRGQHIWNASHSHIWKTKMGDMEIPNIERKKNWKFSQKVRREVRPRCPLYFRSERLHREVRLELNGDDDR